MKLEDKSLFATSICDLVSKSREFELLLGVLNKDATRKPGIIDKFNVSIISFSFFIFGFSDTLSEIKLIPKTLQRPRLNHSVFLMTMLRKKFLWTDTETTTHFIPKILN